MDTRQSERLQSAERLPVLPAITPDPQARYEAYPFTDLQQAYWIGQTSMIELGNLFAHAYMEFEFTNLDLGRLQGAIQRLVERHDTLRSVCLPDGQQRVLREVPRYEIAVNDFRDQDEQAVAEQLLAMREELSRHGPDTGFWPLWEIRASLLDQQRTRLHINYSLLLVDARSTVILTREVLQLYHDPDIALPPLELTCRDYILALRELETTALYQRSAAYWQKRLASLPASPELPLTRRPGDLSTARFVSRTARLDASTWQRLKSLAIRQGLFSPTAALYTAYAEILATWSKTAHFTLNLLFSNRFPMHPQVRALVGNLSSTVLLEVDHRAPAAFSARARQLQRQLQQDLAHSYVSGISVNREIAKARGWTSQALTPVTFASSLEAGAGRDKGMFSGTEEQGKLAYYCIETPQVYLDHQVYEDRGGLLLKWDMIDELLPEDVPEEMFAAYCRLLQTLAEDEAAWQRTTVSLVPERQIALHEAVNATAAPLPGGLLHTLVQEQVKRRPAQPAVITSKRTLSYAEMQRLANRIGHWLRQVEARPNMLVGIVMEKGWEQIVAALGVHASGAAYLPIDPALPQERLRYLFEHGEVRFVLTQPWIAHKLTWPDSIQHLCVTEEDLASLPESDLPALQQPGDLAYVIYTSGSTGQPKGVMIDHRGAVNTLADLNKRFRVGPDDRVLALSALSFDLSVYDIFGILAAGGTVVIPDAEAAQNPEHWAHLLKHERITIWNSVPALMEMLVEHLASLGELLPGSLRLALLSGDWIPVRLPDKMWALTHNEKLEIISLGGATEASIWSIFYPIAAVPAHWKSIPYGRPLTNQQVYVFDSALRHRPVWVPGQIYLGGVGLAQGYWRDPAKTEASFITHPQTGERLYRTGDLGRYLPDGTIEFLGREDFQVKVQGYRIELGEIEVALTRHPAVSEAVATVEKGTQGGNFLIAYVVFLPGQSFQPDDLCAFLRTKLPGYMVPAALGVIEAIPLSANGKVDRKALPRWKQAESSERQGFVVPQDEVERQLATLWETILERQPIGVNDNFFELGGNSLAALRLMGQLRQQFAQELSPSLLFESATISHLAHALRTSSAARSQPRSPLIAIQATGTRPAFFCVHPVGGGVLCYAQLARYLGAEQPFYAFQAPGLDDETKPYTDLKEMAGYYRAAMQVAQPTGPYLLGGWSMGGVVALEIAQQLQNRGEKVALLALLDSDVPTRSEDGHLLDEVSLLLWFAKDLGESSGRHLAVEKADLQPLSSEERISYVLQQARLARALSPEVDAIHLRRLVRVFQANARALLTYAPQTYASRAVLLATSETLALHKSDQTSGWGALMGGTLQTYALPGNHYTMLTFPHVQVLAERLKQCFEES